MKYLGFIASCVVIFIPLLTFAQGDTVVYRGIVSIPGVSSADGTNLNFNDFINALYALSISIAALLAVVKIIIGGMKWMLSDVVTTKSEAKKDIQGALLGLIIVIAAVLIIIVINPAIIGADPSA